MSTRPFTRRSLLAAGGGALAARTLAGPAGIATAAGAAAAALDPPGPRVADARVGPLTPGRVRRLALADNADLVGVQWRGPARPRLEVRFARAAAPERAGGGLRGRAAGPTGGATFGPWVAAGGHGHGPDGADGADSADAAGAAGPGGQVAGARADTHFGEPLWTGGTRLVELRCDRALSDVRLHLVDVSAGLGAAAVARSRLGAAAASVLGVGAAALPLAASPLAAGPGVPPIIARRAWAGTGAPPKVSPAYGEVRLAFVHHTENPNGYARAEVPAMLLAIYAFHRFVRGWNDIGYNFVLDSFGRIFEARAGGIEEPVIGAQAGGYNAYSTGIAVLGSFSSASPTPRTRDALERLLAWKLSLHGAPLLGRTTVRVTAAGAVYSRFPAGARVPLQRISGHRDGDSTDCPGEALYRLLPWIRTAANARTPAPTVLTLALAKGVATPPSQPPEPPPQAGGLTGPPATAAPVEPAPGLATLTGTLAVLGGAPLAGATVVVQARRVRARGRQVQELTLASATTDAQGRYTATLPAMPVPKAGLALRAVYAGPAGPIGAAPVPPPPGAPRACASRPLELLAAQLRPSPAPAPSPPAPAPPAA